MACAGSNAFSACAYWRKRRSNPWDVYIPAQDEEMVFRDRDAAYPDRPACCSLDLRLLFMSSIQCAAGDRY